MRPKVQIGLSIALGFLLMFPLGWVFDVMEWPTFYSLALAHACTFTSAWPTLAVVSFALLNLTPWFRRTTDALLIAPAALVGLGITAVSAVSPYYEPAALIGLGTPLNSYYEPNPIRLPAIAFGSSAALGYFARRPWVVALVLALPEILNYWLFLQPFLGHMNFYSLSCGWPIVISAFLGMGVAYATKRVIRG